MTRAPRASGSSPGRPRDSAIYVRAGSRTSTLSMPPLATHLVDHEAVAMLDRWIRTLAPADSEGQAR